MGVVTWISPTLSAPEPEHPEQVYVKDLAIFFYTTGLFFFFLTFGRTLLPLEIHFVEYLRS